MAAKAWTDPHPIATIPVDVTGKQITPIINKQLISLIWTYFFSLFHRHHRDFDGYEDFDAVFGFPSFVFRDPEEVFREFFGGADPFEDLLDRKLILNNHPGFLMSERSMNATFFTLSAFGLMGGRHRSARSARHHHHSPYHHPAHQHHHAASNALVNPVFRDPFAGFGMSPSGLLGGPLMGFGGGPHRSIFDEFDDGMQMHHPGMQMHPAAVGGGFTSVQTFSGSMGGLNGGVGMRSSSTSTRFVNGKKITTKRYAIRFFFFSFFFFLFFLHK